jgi:hypothetical protein
MQLTVRDAASMLGKHATYLSVVDPNPYPPGVLDSKSFRPRPVAVGNENPRYRRHTHAINIDVATRGAGTSVTMLQYSLSSHRPRSYRRYVYVNIGAACTPTPRPCQHTRSPSTRVAIRTCHVENGRDCVQRLCRCLPHLHTVPHRVQHI